MKNFDAYEYVGLIAPGAIVTIGIFLEFPAARAELLSKDFSLGSLGIFLIISFAIGHLVAAIGNAIEGPVLKISGGLPSDKVRSENQTLISSSQRLRLNEKARNAQGDAFDLSTVSKGDWYAITREIYAEVAAAKTSSRVDSFNRQYGLLRGVGSAFSLLTIWFLVNLKAAPWSNWSGLIPAAFTAVACLLSFVRMTRFANNYARELFVQYVRLPDRKDAPPDDAPATLDDASQSKAGDDAG